MGIGGIGARIGQFRSLGNQAVWQVLCYVLSLYQGARWPCLSQMVTFVYPESVCEDN